MSDVTPSDMPTGLADRGRALWHAMVSAYVLGPGQLVLVAEACRLADRLERMDALLAGDSEAWATVLAGEGFDAPEIKVEVSSVLIEARLTATALKGLVAELRQAGAGGMAPAAPAEPHGGAPGEVGGGLSEFERRVAAKQRAAQG
jgi:hypothetical protein